MRQELRRSVDVQVEAAGRLPSGSAEYARRKIEHVLRRISRPVLFARVRLSTMADPAVSRPAIVQVNLDVDGRLIRAHVAAQTVREAVDLVEERLRERVYRLLPDWESLRGSRPAVEPGEWRHTSLRAHRPAHFPRPADERQVVRHKAFTLRVATPDEAAFDMELADYDFFLFTEAATGEDSVLYRDPAGGYRLAQVHPRPDRLGPTATPLTVSEHAAARLTVEEAVDRLHLSGLPFVFFADLRSGRGNVLYYRYDGHYGLITPAM